MDYLGLPTKDLKSNYNIDDSWEFIEWSEKASIDALDQFIAKNQEEDVSEIDKISRHITNCPLRPNPSK